MAALGFARQQWRAWIETPGPELDTAKESMGSPASNGGRGLKRLWLLLLQSLLSGSPASNGGRGLKHVL